VRQTFAKLHSPGLHPDAAKWLADTRKVNAVGLGTASIDYGQSTLFETHRILYERNLPAFENLTALDQLPPRGAVVYALPIKIKGGSGGPLRAIAVLQTARNPSSRAFILDIPACRRMISSISAPEEEVS
jgi:kynurenine formamidase